MPAQRTRYMGMVVIPTMLCYLQGGGVALYLARVARLVKFKILGGRPVLGARGTAGKF